MQSGAGWVPSCAITSWLHRWEAVFHHAPLHLLRVFWGNGPKACRTFPVLRLFQVVWLRAINVMNPPLWRGQSLWHYDGPSRPSQQQHVVRPEQRRVVHFSNYNPITNYPSAHLAPARGPIHPTLLIKYYSTFKMQGEGKGLESCPASQSPKIQLSPLFIRQPSSQAQTLWRYH